MNRATPYRHQPGHEERSLFSYFRSIFQKYADRDFFFIGRTAAYFFFFCAAVYAAMDSVYCRTIPILAMDSERIRGGLGAGDRSGYEWVLDETDRC